MSNISLWNCGIADTDQSIPYWMYAEGYFHLGNRMVHPVIDIGANTVVVDTVQTEVTSNWCITLLKIISYITIVIPLIIAILVLINRCTVTVQTPMDMLLIMDPNACLERLHAQSNNLESFGISWDRWDEAICDFNPHTKTPEQQAAFVACVDFLISHNLVQEEPLFRKAVNLHKSPACVDLLLTRGNIPFAVQQECLQEAVQRAHADIALLLCNGDIPTAAELFFDRLSGLDENQLRRAWARLYRLNPITLIDNMTDPFVQSFSDEGGRRAIRRILAEVRSECMQWLPHVSQHDKPTDIGYIQDAYQRNDDATATAADRDRAYGMRCVDFVGELLTRYRENPNLEPVDEKYRAWPTGQNGRRTVAWFTEQVATFRNRERQGHDVQPRREGTHGVTPISCRYRWAYTLLGEELSRNHNCPSSYNNRTLTKIELRRWHHGLQPVSFTWPDIEDEFQVVIAMNPADDPEQFYKHLIKLMWLIGNTTPLNRGTGSVVESMWIFVHRYWNLPVPKLKNEYPQFDVINISSKLEAYQNIWRRYFDPATLMPSLLESATS